MNNLKFKYSLLCLLFLYFNILLAQESDGKGNTNSVNPANDTIKISKEKLEGLVETKGDEIRNIFSKKTTYLIQNAKVVYQDMTITADYIVIDWDSGDVFARGKVDSTGRIIENMIFTQADRVFEQQEAVFNINTKQGIAYNARTEEEGIVIIANISKRINDEDYYIKGGTMTPDEYFIAKKDSLTDVEFRTQKMKLINKKDGGKELIGSLTYMIIEQVPTPILLPFLYIPSTGSKREAGILIGTFGERQSKGFYLENWGVYVPIGEYLDLESRFGFYTKGSWLSNNRLRYEKRYRFSGDFYFTYEKNITSTKGLPDYSQSENYRLQWTHSQNTKANPNLSFNSSIDYMSQNYYTNSIYNQNIIRGNITSNQTTSSISLVKRFYNNPFTLSLNIAATQNISDGNVSMTFPSLSATMPQIYPFAPKSGTKKTLLHNFYLDYRMNLQNSVNTTTDNMFTSKMFDGSQNGMKNETNFGTSATILNYFQLGLSGNYKENWTLKTITKEYNASTLEVETKDNNGFKSFRTFGGSASLNTTLYGQANFKDESMIKAIRHMVTPSISYNYTPDFSTNSWGYYDKYIDKDGNEVKYSYFEKSVLGSPSNYETSSIGISIANNIEMKVRDKKDTKGYKKLKILESLNLSTAYNFAADSLRWSPLNISASTSLLNSLFRVNYSMVVNPYKIEYDEKGNGNNVDKFGHFSFTNVNIGVNFSLSQDLFKKKGEEKKYHKQGTIRYEKYQFDDENYARFDIPWQLNIGFIYNHSKSLNINSSSKDNFTLNLNGDISPAPYWRITANTNFDLDTNKFGYTSLGFSRDLRSFTINFNWVPISNSNYKTWDFFIGIKSPILSDALKYEARNFNDNNNSF